MALALVKAGTRLLVWNRTRARAEILAAAGADVAREAADVFAHSATVFLMLVDGEAIDTVLDRGGAAFAARVIGRTVVHGDLRVGTERSSDEALGQSVPDFTRYGTRRSRAFCRSPRASTSISSWQF
jgi:hypothetical protein